MDVPLGKLDVPLAPLLPRLELDEAGAGALAGVATASDALLRLEAAAQNSDAVRLVAHALPRREAVWWACMCARGVPVADLPEADSRALEAAEAWVRHSRDEPLRRAAWAAAQATLFRSPEAWAAVGAFWSGGSLSPEGQPVVPPAEHLTGVAVSGAVVLASVRTRPEQADARLRRFIASAKDIARGGAGRLTPEEA